MQGRKVRIALYARKSKFTGKGESVQNQISACKKYVEDYFPEGEWEIRVYKDEGVSGKSLERPEMQRMLRDIEEDNIDMLICYRLDRVSRNVRDFSNLIEQLTEWHKEFISVKEAFDTRNPMGRAMMMISSVFSQLERETIAERITDNMYALAKTGRWLGGSTPLGFESRQVVHGDMTGKKRSYFMLMQRPEEVEMVRLIYGKYIELGSLTKLEAYLMNANYHTRNGKYYGRYVLRSILVNPVYCVADGRAWDFLKEKGYGVYAENTLFDGKHGLIAYNKNNGKGRVQRQNAVGDWVVSVGEHMGIIDSATWIEVQNKIRSNRKLSYRSPQKNEALFSGIVRCACCNSFMRPKSSRRARDGTLHYFYVCEKKEKSRGTLCQMKNIPGHRLDLLVADEVFMLADKVLTENTFLEKEIRRLEKMIHLQLEGTVFKQQMKSNRKQIETLLAALGKSTNEITTDIILQKINQLNEEQEALKEQARQEEIRQSAKVNKVIDEGLAEKIISMDRGLFDKLPAAKRKEILAKVIKEIFWDGESAVMIYQ